MSETVNEPKAKATEETRWLDLVRQQVGSLRYGVVEIIVHDSHVIQIERTERLRLEKNPAGANGHL